MSEQEEYYDDSFIGTGEAGEEGETWSDEQYDAPPEIDLDQLREELRAELRQELEGRDAQAIEFAQAANAYHYNQAQEQAEQQGHEQQMQDELQTLESALGRPVNPSEWAAMQHIAENAPVADSLFDVYEAVQGMSKAERMQLGLRARNPEPDTVSYHEPADWSDDPDERRQQRIQYAYAQRLKLSGRYEDGE